MHRLEEVVKRLEGGELSLEDSLKAFEEGIRLVRKGEALLSQAEKRIEELLEEGGTDRAVPLRPAGAPGPSHPASAPRSAKPEEEEDVPF